MTRRGYWGSRTGNWLGTCEANDCELVKTTKRSDLPQVSTRYDQCLLLRPGDLRLLVIAPASLIDTWVKEIRAGDDDDDDDDDDDQNRYEAVCWTQGEWMLRANVNTDP